MPDTPQSVQRTYLVLTLFTTLAASFIWGINRDLRAGPAGAERSLDDSGVAWCPAGLADRRGRERGSVVVHPPQIGFLQRL